MLNRKKFKNKLLKPNKLFNKVSKLSIFNKKSSEEIYKEAIKEAGAINDKNLSKHRESVLSGARKFIYPLNHSRHRLIRNSIGLFLAAAVIFIVFCVLELYLFQSTSGFIYTVSDVIPFPIAKVDSRWVSYHSYLFELRRNMHYYQSQQGINFSSPNEAAQLKNLKQIAMNKVIDDAIVGKLAYQYHISVTTNQVNNEIKLLQEQNKLGSNINVLESVLKSYWGWTLGDFKSELKTELLEEAVIAKLDTKTTALAHNIYNQLLRGGNFSALAAQYSDDSATKGNGGAYLSPITPNDPTVSPIVINELNKLKVGQVSPIINDGFSLEILKVNSIDSSGIEASHIQLNFQSLKTLISPILKKYPPVYFISI